MALWPGSAPVSDLHSDSNAEPTGPGGEDQLKLKLAVFEGPLDLLLHLIRKQEIDIADIPIVQITEQYMQYLAFMKELDLDVAGEYLVMASTLVHIKSKMLLPVEPEAEDEQAEDPRAELVRQLLEYEQFRHAAEELRTRRLLEQAQYTRGGPSEFDQEEELLLEASLFDLMAAFRELLATVDEPQVLAIESYRVSVADRVQQLMEDLLEKRRFSFRELFPSEMDRHHWIVTFLALLELVRLRQIVLMQRGRLGPIEIVRLESEAASEEPDSGPQHD
jgi:segregation and condensation protein A